MFCWEGTCPELVNLLRVILCKECNDSPLTKVLVGTTHRQAQLAEKESDQDNISDVHIFSNNLDPEISLLKPPKQKLLKRE